MSGVYNILDQIIDDYVGVEPVEQYTMFDDEVQPVTSYVSVDPDLRDSIVRECTRHIEYNVPTYRLSKDARWCINEWERALIEREEVNGTDYRNNS